MCVLVFATALTAAPGRDRALELSQQLRRTGGMQEKIRLGEKLGRLRTARAKERLLSLLEDKHYWNRTAAVHGLVLIPEPEVTRALVRRMLTDHMVDDVIERLLAQEATRHFSHLKAIYATTTPSKDRLRVLPLVGAARSPEAALWLRAIVDSKEPERELALTVFIRHHNEGNGAVIRSYRHDPALQPAVLRHLVRSGGPEDLAFCEEVIRHSAEGATVALAYVGVQRWATPARREQVFLEALGSREPKRTIGALGVFEKVRSDRLRVSLARLVRRADHQTIRLEAARRLIEYNEADTIAPLVLVLREEYIPAPRPSALVTLLLGFVTVGIVPALMRLSEDSTHAGFERRRQGIVAALRRRTGQKLGGSYTEWFDWAIFAGHTVDGHNLIQELFSGHPQRRAQARQATARLLGSELARAGGIEAIERPTPESDLLLARELIRRGLLRDEL